MPASCWDSPRSGDREKNGSAHLLIKAIDLGALILTSTPGSNENGQRMKPGMAGHDGARGMYIIWCYGYALVSRASLDIAILSA